MAFIVVSLNTLIFFYFLRYRPRQGLGRSRMCPFDAAYYPNFFNNQPHNQSSTQQNSQTKKPKSYDKNDPRFSQN